jgi:hypothetical protein
LRLISVDCEDPSGRRRLTQEVNFPSTTTIQRK